MTHLEPFYYPVWDMPNREDVKPAENPVFVLFDYEMRSPLTGDARTVVIE
jgi:hypothetical protein